jgi:membrane protein DedA with SNARE-associated domain
MIPRGLYPGGGQPCATIADVALSSTAPHLAVTAAGLQPHLSVAASTVHHLRHEPFDFAGLAAAAAASWFGIPGPGEPVLIAAGVLAAQHRLDLLPVLIVAWLGATAGGIAGWALGRKAGRALLTWRGPLWKTRVRAVARGEELFGRHPVIGILLTPSWIAGINRPRPAVFLSVNAASAAVWAAGIGLGAYLAGPAVLEVVNDVGTATAILLLVAVAGAIFFEVWRRRLRRA